MVTTTLRLHSGKGHELLSVSLLRLNQTFRSSLLESLDVKGGIQYHPRTLEMVAQFSSARRQLNPIFQNREYSPFIASHFKALTDTSPRKKRLTRRAHLSGSFHKKQKFYVDKFQSPPWRYKMLTSPRGTVITASKNEGLVLYIHSIFHLPLTSYLLSTEIQDLTFLSNSQWELSQHRKGV